ACDQRGLLLHPMIDRAVRAVVLRRPRRPALLARVQILQRSFQLLREGLVAGDGLARFGEALLENASNRCHGLGPVPRTVPCAEQGLDLVERKAAALEQLDPTDARYGGSVVEAKATVRPRGRVEELQLFI